jgi:hypothetical protein
MKGMIAVRLILYHLGTPSQRLGDKKGINSFMREYTDFLIKENIIPDIESKPFKATIIMTDSLERERIINVGVDSNLLEEVNKKVKYLESRGLKFKEVKY